MNKQNNFMVVAQIVQCEKHPDSHKLSVCQVDDGEKTWQVVCGANNVRIGMLSILAKTGATLPNGKKIQNTELRGVQSHGMLCLSLIHI